MLGMSAPTSRVRGPKNGALRSIQPKSCVVFPGWDVAVGFAAGWGFVGCVTFEVGVENSGNDGYPCLLFIKNPVPYLN